MNSLDTSVLLKIMISKKNVIKAGIPVPSELTDTGKKKYQI
jgi:hypothetical protein